ncbi:MAG: beta-lactamase family protein [Ignavibacteriae bacterium]|nr:beta-lactamase family protein [Ignavibacteriota bacterium]
MIKYFSVIIIMLLIPFSLFAQDSYSAKIDSLMKAQAEVNHFNGNVLVAQSGNIIYQNSFGYRNFETKELLDNNSVFELASVSKQFTAMGILLLIEKGKLSLSDSLRQFFPELPYSDITIQNLLTHTSGLPDYMEAMNAKWDHKKVAFNDDVIKFLATEKIPANFSPGEKFEYSNTAYEMLASIVEKVSGQSFKDYMEENIFRPLGMNNSRVYNTRRSSYETIPNYAYGFVYSDSLKKYILPDSIPELDIVYWLDGVQGDGIINSTAGDLLIWDRALKNNVLLSEAMQSEMFKPQSVIDSSAKMYYGYGEFLFENKYGKSIYHSGGWPGYSTILKRFLSNDATIIILSNNESDVRGISEGITGILFGDEVIFPYVHKALNVDKEILKKYAGSYTGVNLKIDIIFKDGKLYRDYESRPDIELIPESETKFFYEDGRDLQIEFQTGPDYNIEKIWLISGGLKTELKKN